MSEFKRAHGRNPTNHDKVEIRAMFVEHKHYQNEVERLKAILSKIQERKEEIVKILQQEQVQPAESEAGRRAGGGWLVEDSNTATAPLSVSGVGALDKLEVLYTSKYEEYTNLKEQKVQTKASIKVC